MRFCVYSAGILAGIALFGPISAAAQPTEKGFELCNRTNLTVVYAKALNLVSKKERTKGTEYRFDTEGWFDLAPGNCKVLWPGELKYRFYLMYAGAKASNRKWTGDRHPICVRNGQFKITSIGLCATNKNHRMFFEVDTGDNKSYTYDLR